MRVDKNIYLNNARTRVVPEDDPSVGWLLAAKGTVLEDDVARQYGLLPEQQASRAAVEETGEAKAVEQPPEDKAVAAPPFDKRVWPKGNKRGR